LVVAGNPKLAPLPLPHAKFTSQVESPVHGFEPAEQGQNELQEASELQKFDGARALKVMVVF